MTDMNPLTAEYIEAATVMLRLSAAIRPKLKRWDHKAFAATGLQSLYDNTITVADIETAIETAARQEGL